MITAKAMREALDNAFNKKLDMFLNSVMMDAVLKQKTSPIEITSCDIQKFVGSKRVDLADTIIKMLKDNGYTARIEARMDGGYIVAVVKVWWWCVKLSMIGVSYKIPLFFYFLKIVLGKF